MQGTDVVGLRGAPLTSYRQRTVGVVFQTFNLVPSLKAWENVELTPGRVGDPGGSVTHSLAPGEVLFHEGDFGDHAYIVESGLVELVRRLDDGGERVMLRAGPRHPLW